jgi:hypothetical protein
MRTESVSLLSFMRPAKSLGTRSQSRFSLSSSVSEPKPGESFSDQHSTDFEVNEESAEPRASFSVMKTGSAICVSRTFLHQTPRNALYLTLLLRCIWSLRGYNLDFDPSRGKNVVRLGSHHQGARYYCHESTANV